MNSQTIAPSSNSAPIQPPKPFTAAKPARHPEPPATSSPVTNTQAQMNSESFKMENMRDAT